MISYSEREIFGPIERYIFRMATRLIEQIDEQVFDDEIRCHEVARAVGKILMQPHQDGKYLSVQHTWLRVGTVPPGRTGCPAILDVYSVGSMPQVQMMDTFPLLKRLEKIYKPGPERTDIRQDVVTELLRQMDAKECKCYSCGTMTSERLCGKCAGEG